MKILYLIDKIDFGGVETVITNLALMIYKKFPQTEIHILTPNRNKSLNYELLIKAGIKIFYTDFEGRLNPLNIYSYFRIIYKTKYDIIHVNHLRQQYWGALISIFYKKCEYITTEHGMYNKKRDIIFMNYLDKFIYSRYSKIISVSYATQNALLDWLKIKKEDKYLVVYNGINIDHFINAKPLKRENFHFNNNDIIIISVNRMTYGKDIATILKALTILPDRYKFIAVGDGPELELNKSLSIKLKVDKRVYFTGFIADVSHLLKLSDVYVASTLFEGFSTSIIEAFAADIPVIGTNISPVKEVLKDDKYLFDIGDFDKLASILQSLNLSHCKEEIKSHKLNYTIDKMALNYYNIYKSCLDNSKRI